MAGSSNFIQQNPSTANQETDAQYQADSLTTGGIGVDAILRSSWLNKYFYQQSTFVAAFCQMMANKGYALSDASITTLEAVLANVLTNADTKTPLINVAYAATPTFDCSVANGFFMILSGNVSSVSLVNMAIGQTVTIIVQQNGTGGYSFATPSGIQSGHWWPVNQTANAFTCQQFTKTPAGNIVRMDTSELDLQAAVNAINTAISTINGEVSTLQSQVSTLQGQVSTINSEISGIDSSITTLQGQVSTLTGQVSGLSSQVANLNTIVNPIPGEITTLTSEVNSLTGAFGQTHATNGYCHLYGGLILQWGTAANGGAGNTYSQSFPIAFPNACLACCFTAQYESGQHTSLASILQGTLSASGFEWTVGSGGDVDGYSNPMFIAIGY